MSRTFGDTRTYAGEHGLLEAPRTAWVETGEYTSRKRRRLSCLCLRSRKPFQGFRSNCVPNQALEKEVTQMDFVPSRRSRRNGIQEVKEEFRHSSSPVMNVIESIRSWLLCYRYERPREVHDHDPFASYLPSSVVPIHTDASILQYQPPVPSSNSSGVTAQESAQAQDSKFSQGLADELSERSPHYPPSYQNIDPRFNLLGQTLTQHVESGVNLETDRSSLEDNKGVNDIIRKGTFKQSFHDSQHLPGPIDPFTYLPPELTAAILSHLDSTSLARSELVSKTWSRVARQPRSWKEVFRNETHRERQNSMARSNQYSISGAGLGTASPNQNYKLMLQARRTLQKRWRDGRASAIYLEGHTDSVYCVQFDE